MTGLCLLAILILAKGLVLATRPIAISPWSPVAYFSQDLVVAALAALLDLAAGRRRLTWAIYGVAVLWVALNVPIAIVLGSPLTVPMLRAARGPLADSVAQYLTTANIARVVICVGAGLAIPLVVARSRRFRFPSTRVLFAFALTAFFLAPIAGRHVDTGGLDRNAFTALLPVRLPAVSAAAGSAGLRVSPFPAAGFDDLSRYREAARGLNVVMVVLESTAAGYLRTYGAAEDPMPNLTTIGARAMVWENAYAVYPESIKELFVTLCARYPAFNEGADGLDAIPCDSFTGRLKAAGYRTGLFHSGRFDYLGMEAVVRGKGFEVLEDAGEIGGNVRSSFGVDEPATVDRLLAWVDSVGPDGRFFAAYLPIAGHHPYATPAPGPFDVRDPLGQYRNALHYADAALGRLLDGLRARRLADRTMVVILGDHGEAFGQHPGNVGHTLFVHEENVRVPFLISLPDPLDAPIRVPAVASAIDTAPTILDLLGLPSPPAYDGASLLQAAPRMAFFFTDYALGWLGVRDGCWKDVLEVGSGRSKLFDLCRDPGETVDRSSSAPERVRAYRSRIEQWSAASLARGQRN